MRNYPTHVGTEKDKNHTREEGRAHPRISVWHSLMNLKNNYLLKKLLKWANKKCKYFNIYKNKKELKKNTWRYHYFMPVYLQSSWYDL